MPYLRALLACLLTLALPLQGYASMVMPACSGQAGIGIVSADELTPMSAAPDGADPSTGKQSAVIDDLSASTGTPGVGDHHGCGLGAVCSACHGIAMFHAPSIPLAQEILQVAPVGPLYTLATAIVNPLEKPPRF